MGQKESEATDWKDLQNESQVWIRKWGIGRLSFQPLGIRLVMMQFTEIEKIGGRTIWKTIDSVLDQFSLEYF